MGHTRIPSSLDLSLTPHSYHTGSTSSEMGTSHTLQCPDPSRLYHSPVAPMEDLGTLKEQHREQKLLPQLLQLRCQQESRSVCDHPQSRHPQLSAPQIPPKEPGTSVDWGDGQVGQD